MFVTFVEQGRTGNLIFQYLACKLIQLNFGHTYIPYEKFIHEFNSNGIIKDYIQIEEDDFFQIFQDEKYKLTDNVLLKGYYQKSDMFVKYRKELLELLDKSLNDTWKLEGKEYSISKFLNYDNHKLPISKEDIVINLRLDDFIQLPRERSDILPPGYYLEMLNSIPKTPETKIYIICDKIRYTWEQEYLDCFKKYNVQIGIPGYDGSLDSDFAILRDCGILIHSNSTFCWMASFLSKNESKLRFIPRTHFYGGQNLKKINETIDTLLDVKTLSHHDVFNLKSEVWKKYPIHSFSYCIPDHYIVSSVPEKTCDLSEHTISKLGEKNHTFTKSEEQKYYKVYQNAKFANTQKRGGWDALRHYEILMNGCIPIFENLEFCPTLTMSTFPKKKLIEIKKNIEEYKNSNELYTSATRELLNELRLCNSSSTRVKDFLGYMNIHSSKPRILLLCGDMGVNYLRDFFWIGMKTMYPDTCIEYPCLEYIYDDYKMEDFSNLHGNGFCYGGTVNSDKKKYISEKEIKFSLDSKDFDVIVYGKTGPDEGYMGTFPNLPFWKEVFDSKIPIAFLYGGDEQFKISSEYSSLSGFDKKYVDHLRFHSQFGTCFVRELN
jgi:hypothetical protein